MRFLVLTLLLATTTCAYSEDRSLRGLNPIAVLVEELSEAATKCGITAESIRSAAAGPLSESRLQIADSPAAIKGYLYVQVNMLALQDTCVGNIYVSFRTVAVIQSNDQTAIAAIWNENILGAAWPEDAPRKISGGVETLTRKFVDRWTRDNP
jgi:hypothetical protein